MKSFLFTLSLSLCFLHTAMAQNVSINTTGDPAHPSAMLDVSSTDKGMLVPRMDSYQRSMIVNPAQGLLVYDTSTRSFWFFDSSWEEISSSGMPGGPASGDLSGNYPAPNVAKIQNLDVAFGVPFDKQVLKWDALSNNWKGRNDSLFLPYNATYGSPTNLFGIINTNNTVGSSAIYGRSGNFSGINPGTTKGVWGDNALGIGVAGTSHDGNGVLGSSVYNHGIIGYSGNTGFAGVYGSNLEYGGIGVMGEMEDSDGIAMMGSILGANGKAGVFQTPTSNHSDTTFVVTTSGVGMLSMLNVSNTTNNKPALDIEHAGTGRGLQIRLNNAAGSANALDILSQGSGIGVYSKSQNGIPGKFEITNSSNTYPGLMVGTNSLGTALYVSSTNTGLTGNVVDVLNSGTGTGLSILSEKGNAATFTVADPTVNKNNLSVQQHGTGKGIYINMTNASSTNPAVDIVSQGTKGVWSQVNNHNAIAVLGSTGGTANNAIGVKGVTAPNVMNGIGVLGQAGVNDPNGIGVKGIAGGDNDGGIGVLGETSANTPQAIAVKGIGYSHNEDVGAITGINMVDGVGVYGEAMGFDGIGVAGTVGNTNQHSVAGVFTNTYTENNRSVVEVITNGKGNGLLIDHNHMSNNSPLLRMTNSGNGDFVRFENGLGDIKTTINKEGNLVTDGMIKVNGDKGIVRSSTSSQLKVEIIEASFDGDGWEILSPMEARWVPVTFTTPFSVPPAVYVADIIQNGNAYTMLTFVIDVTTSGCTLFFVNPMSQDIAVSDSTWKLVAMGAE